MPVPVLLTVSRIEPESPLIVGGTARTGVAVSVDHDVPDVFE
jgi:hypothetical protein